MVTTRSDTKGDAIDLLETEDLELRRRFMKLRLRRGSSVEDRADYGNLAKQVIRQLGIREAALVDVARVAVEDPCLEEVSRQFEATMPERRRLMDRVEKMSRGIQGINLRTGQDFDAVMEELIGVVGTEIEWDLNTALPAIRGSLRGTGRQEQLHSAEHLERHAPTNLHPRGPRWRERAPVVSRLLTIFDRLRDFPRSSARSR